MNFLKKVGINTDSITNQAKQVANQAAGAVVQQMFNHFTGGQTNAAGQPAMDVSKLVDMTKVTGVIDNKLKEVDVEKIFDEVKEGGEEVLNFDKFKEGLQKMADKKYDGLKGSAQDRLDKLENDIVAKADSIIK